MTAPPQDRGERGLLAWARRSLQRQFALIAGLLILVSSGIFLLIVTQSYRASILSAHEAASMNVNLLLQAALENAMINRDLDGLRGIVARLGEQEGVTGVMIANPDGEIRFSSYPGRIGHQLEDEQFHAARATGERQAGIRALDGDTRVLRSINPVHNQQRCQVCHGPIAEHPVNGLLVVDYDSSGVEQAAWRGALLLAGLGIAVLALLEAGLWAALRRLVLVRIDRLNATTRQIASGALSVRSGASGADEIALLGQSFDNMAAQLDAKVQELNASQALLQALVDAIPDGVRVIGPDFRIVMANQAYCRQIGADPATVAGQTCWASSHKRNGPCVPTLVRCPVVEILQDGGDALKCSHTHVDAHGAALAVEVSAAPVTMMIDGVETRCVVEAIRDLETDLSISQNQRLAEMGMLAAGVAHEVSNPLASISLVLREIRSQANLPDQVQRDIGLAETEIENCRAITDSLLRLSAPSDGHTGLIDIAAVLHDTAALLRLEAEQSGVTIVEQISGQSRVVATDSDMRILIFNLALNAIHSMPTGGTMQLGVDTAGGAVRLSVEDTGVGIAERDKSKILLPFWTRRADGTRGRGLGLAICSSIVKNLGGELSFDSTVGVGTRFTVTLPDADSGDWHE